MYTLLATDRLTLRRFTHADADLIELDSDPDVMRFLGGEPTPRRVIEEEILPRFCRYDDRFPGYGFWAAEERATGRFLGWFSLRPRDRAKPNEVELGFRLRKRSWGKGYATEGARALIRRVFTELGAERVVATTYEENLASRRVLETVGLEVVRRFRPTPEELAATGTFHVSSQEVWEGDDLEYALSRCEREDGVRR